MPRLLSTAVLLSLLVVRPAGADPVAVTSGFLIFTDEPGAFSLAGNDFVLTGEWFPTVVSGTFWFDQCQPCEPGSVVDFGTTTYRFSQSDLSFAPSSGVLGGASYSELFLDADLTFNGPRLVAPLTGGTSQGSFTMEGSIAAYLDRAHTSGPVWSSDLFGSGVAIASFGPGVALNELEYLFVESDPVPEPSTLLLIGAGCRGAPVQEGAFDSDGLESRSARPPRP
jgi:hypothetical protein